MRPLLRAEELCCDDDEEGRRIQHYSWTVACESLIYVMAQAKPTTPHIIAAILKCSTPRLGLSIANFGTCNHGANVLECPSHHSSVVLNQVIPPNGIDHPNGQSFLGINARTECRTKPHADPKLNGIHCEDWTPEEAEYTASVLRWFILVLCYMQIPIMFIDLGGTGCARIIKELKIMMLMMCQGFTDEDQRTRF